MKDRTMFFLFFFMFGNNRKDLGIRKIVEIFI